MTVLEGIRLGAKGPRHDPESRRPRTEKSTTAPPRSRNDHAHTDKPDRPAEIAEIATKTGGRIGLTFCPGKKQPTAYSGAWDRDLDLAPVSAWGASVVVSLIEQREMAALDVKALGSEITAREMVWHHLPIRDVSVPSTQFEATYDRIPRDPHAPGKRRLP